VTTGGGYYAVKHQANLVTQDANTIADEGKMAPTGTETATSSISSTTKPIQPPIVVTVPIKQPAKPKQAFQKVDDSRERFKEFEIQGKQLITLLEQDERNFKLLADTIARHKKQSAEHATKIMNEWIALVDQTLASTPSQYRGMLNSTKDYLAFDRDWVVDYSNSLYDIVSSGSYLLSQNEVDSLKFVKEKVEECLAMDVTEWAVSNEPACTTDFLDMKPNYSERLTNGANRLAEIDLMVLETIGKHARSAEDDVRGDMDSIARYTQLDASIQASYNSINSQLQQRQTQLEAANTPIKCYTSTNDSIFDQNRTYSTTCQLDTRTPQQICDEKIAAWVSSASNGAIIGAKPTCE